MIKFINENLFSKIGKLSSAKVTLFKKTQEYAEILKITDWLPVDSLPPQRIYCVMSEINKPPLCICSSPLKFKGYSLGYAKYCSIKCGIIGSNRKDKTKKTLLDKYGDENYNNRDKQKNTNLEKYGVESTNTLDYIKEKQKNTKIENYGENPNKWIFDNITSKVFLEKYGVSSVPRSNIDYKVLSRKLNPISYELLDDKIWLESQYKEKTTVIIAKELQIAHSTVTNYLIKHNILRDNWINKSGEEQTLMQYVESIYDGVIIRNSRKIISPYEIDIYIPEFNLALEYDGIFWHSDDYVCKDYHLIKTNMCNDINIELLHIFSNEWENKNLIWKSVIANKLKKSNRIYARKCNIRLVSKKEAMEFFNNNHLQGSISKGIHYGLYNNNELVACINYGKSRYGKFDWEIYRFCNLLNTNVVGGFSKLLKYLPITGKIVSYANLRWSNGNLYKKSGFIFSHKSKPNYFYLKKNTIYSREKFQKHKLKNILKIYDENLTEKENMKNNKYHIIHDSGNLIYYISK